MSAPDVSADPSAEAQRAKVEALAKADKGEQIMALAYPVRLSKTERELAGAAARLREKSFSEYVRVLIIQDIKQGDTR